MSVKILHRKKRGKRKERQGRQREEKGNKFLNQIKLREGRGRESRKRLGRKQKVLDAISFSY